MDRKKFIELVGIGAASVAIYTCLGACKKDSPAPSSGSTSPTTPTPSPPSPPEPPNTTLFTVDLSDPANSALNTPGGYIYKQGVIVARAVSGSYIAVSQACTHAGFTVKYVSSPSEFHCELHGSNFTESGAVINGPASVSLTQYNTSLSGNILSIKSS